MLTRSIPIMHRAGTVRRFYSIFLLILGGSERRKTRFIWKSHFHLFYCCLLFYPSLFTFIPMYNLPECELLSTWSAIEIKMKFVMSLHSQYSNSKADRVYLDVSCELRTIANERKFQIQFSCTWICHEIQFHTCILTLN